MHLTVYLLNLNTGVGKYVYRYTEPVADPSNLASDEDM